METLLKGTGLEGPAQDLWIWLQANVLVWESLVQIGFLIVTLVVARLLSRRLNGPLDKLVELRPQTRIAVEVVRPLQMAIIATALLWVAVSICRQFDHPVYVLNTVTNLLTAWVLIRLASNLIRNKGLAQTFATVAWVVAALNIVGLLDDTTAALQGLGFSLGGVQVTAYGVISGIITFVVFIWLALLLGRLADQQIHRASGLNPSLQVLFAKIARIFLITLAIMIALSSAGIDLTALAVFGGALGVGIGFGLQKVVANFISGVILLLDRSIKPGDVVETQGTYGWINKLAARYTSVITRDGTEYLIPNEDMITQPVINWSHSNRLVRRKIPVNVDYDTDLRKAMELMNEAAIEHDRVLSSPEPKTLIKSFGDNGVDLELRMWIDDPQHGVSNVASDVMLAIWDKFNASDIEFPFPQRVVHLIDETDERALRDRPKPPAPTTDDRKDAAE